MDQNVIANRESLEKRPGILMVGSPNVGKRSLLSRLLSIDFEDSSDSASEIFVQGWTINTKYYTADVSMWIAHLHDGFSVTGVPMFDRLTALVMVFDLNEWSSFVELKKWVSRTDIHKFDILLCIGNKVDLVAGHPAHVEYRRRLLKLDEFKDDLNSHLPAYGISETDGIGLLEDQEPSSDDKRSCLEWCLEHNIEFIEACASNAEFDKCLSVNGDSQGLERLFGALSANMWPGMILKSGNIINEPSLPEKQDTSDEESDYEFEYEILSDGLAEPLDDTNGEWVSANPVVRSTGRAESSSHNLNKKECHGEEESQPFEGEIKPSSSTSQLKEEIDERAMSEALETGEALDFNEGMTCELEDLEQLMSEIGGMRDSLRLMPDFQRREMAAKLAMKMASMFGDVSGDEEELDQST